jgi:hypothetical protein
MAEILATPLPEDFYKTQGWEKSLVGHYGETLAKLPVAALKYPMQLLTRAMYDVSYIYGNFPDIVYNALGQTIDPMFSSDEYITKIYNVLIAAGKDENRPYLIIYADGLLTLRRFFERDTEFYSQFHDEIAATPGEGEASKYEKFCSIIQEIVKIHVKQVRKMVLDRK